MNLKEMQEMQKQQAATYGTQTNAAMGDSCANAAGLCGQTQPHRRTEREEAEKRFGHYSAELNKADLAIAFFRDHPEFDEFIQLVRAGAIQI